MSRQMNAAQFSLIILLLVFITGCSSTRLLEQKDYASSLMHYSEGSPEQALSNFPQGEEGAFITSMEKAYLSLLQGKPELERLEYYATTIKNRVRYDVSREVQSFFYADTPEGYYASEHEIIWLHMLLSWGYSLQKRYEAGCVEARYSSHLLSAPWSDEGHFDDATMRLMLANLWVMCGNWSEARVDFRRAFFLDSSLEWAQQLADMEQAPAHMAVVLGGVGASPYWNPDVYTNPIRGLRHLGFQSETKAADLRYQDALQATTLHLSPHSLPWYVRHIQRDNAIHELIEDSRYIKDSISVVVAQSSRIAAAHAVGSTIVVASLISGGAIIYIGLTNDLVSIFGGEGVVAGAGLLVGLIGTVLGLHYIDKHTSDGVEKIKQKLDTSEQYRFVRFLPEYLWMTWSDAPFTLAHQLYTKDSEQAVELSNSPQHFQHGGSSLQLTHISNVKN